MIMNILFSFLSLTNIFNIIDIKKKMNYNKLNYEKISYKY